MSTPDDTNISRSGRIRKKSSKLADFQSPDEISEGTKQRRSSKKDGLSGSIFDPPEDSDSETDFGIDDLEMEIDQFDVRLEDLDNIPDLEDDDFSDSSSRTEIVKKPLNLPMVEVEKIAWGKKLKRLISKTSPQKIKMSSGFVTEAEIEERKLKRQEEWDQVRKAEDPEEAPEEVYDHRSLFDRLEEQRLKKQADWDEEHKFKNQFRGLDDEEVDFLDKIDDIRTEAERKLMMEEKMELEEYQRKQNKIREQELEPEEKKPKLEKAICQTEKVVAKENIQLDASQTENAAIKFEQENAAKLTAASGLMSLLGDYGSDSDDES